MLVYSAMLQGKSCKGRFKAVIKWLQGRSKVAPRSLESSSAFLVFGPRLCSFYFSADVTHIINETHRRLVKEPFDKPFTEPFNKPLAKVTFKIGFDKVATSICCFEFRMPLKAIKGRLQFTAANRSSDFLKRV